LNAAVLAQPIEELTDDGTISESCKDALGQQLLIGEIFAGVVAFPALPFGIAFGFLSIAIVGWGVEKLTGRTMPAPVPLLIGSAILGAVVGGPALEAVAVAMVASLQSSNIFVVGMTTETNYNYPSQCDGENDDVFHYLFHESFMVGLYTYTGIVLAASTCLAGTGALLLWSKYCSHTGGSGAALPATVPYQAA
jgi:hypothetical protein